MEVLDLQVGLLMEIDKLSDLLTLVNGLFVHLRNLDGEIVNVL